MNRKEFLITSWKKGLKPLLIVVGIVFCLKFLYEVIAADGMERMILIFLLGYGLFMLGIQLLSILFQSATQRLNTVLPNSLKMGIRVIIKMLDYISPIVLGVILHQFWKEDWITASIVMAVLLVFRIAELIKEERSAKRSSSSSLNSNEIK